MESEWQRLRLQKHEKRQHACPERDLPRDFGPLLGHGHRLIIDRVGHRQYAHRGREADHPGDEGEDETFGEYL